MKEMQLFDMWTRDMWTFRYDNFERLSNHRMWVVPLPKKFFSWGIT